MLKPRLIRPTNVPPTKLCAVKLIMDIFLNHILWEWIGFINIIMVDCDKSLCGDSLGDLSG